MKAPFFPALLAAVAVVASGCCTRGVVRYPRDPAAEVRAVLERQAADWNRGSVDAFMDGYDRSAGTRFASGGTVTLGWDTVRDRYRRRYPDAATMGHLVFEGIDVTVLAPDAALAFGHWKLERAGDQPSGLFTLLLRRGPDGWKVVHDHTSAATP